jgi:transaldolase
MGRSDAIYQKGKQGKSGEALFFDLAIENLRTAADLFHPIYDRTNWHRWLGFA